MIVSPRIADVNRIQNNLLHECRKNHARKTIETETPVKRESRGELISFTLDFMPDGHPVPTLFVKLMPKG